LSLVAKRMLLEAGEDDDGLFFSFVDESVPPYLRLMAAQTRLADSRPPVAAAVPEPRASIKL
jgi:hypothetical protein